MSQSFTLTRSVPNVIAHIASPGDSGWESYAHVDLDGSTSEGPAGMEARWVFFLRQTQTPLRSLEAASLTASVEIPPSYLGLKARLIVAAPGHLPADLYQYGALPCSIYSGSTDCDSAEIILNNVCCTSTSCDGGGATGLYVRVTEPATGAVLPFDQPVHLRAQLSASVPGAFRWWIAPASNPTQRRLLAPLGGDRTGFSAAYSDYLLDPVAEGLGLGSFVLTVDGGMEWNGCVGSVTGGSVSVTFTHELSAVAPGQALAGSSIRAYGSTFAPGIPITILLDDDPADAANRRSFTLTAQQGRFVTLHLPADISPGLYYLAVGDATGAVATAWKEALQVVAATAQVTNEEDPSCGGPGTECARGIAPGQAITGTWGLPGDVDYFYLTAAQGSTFSIYLQRLDTRLSPLDPDSVDPELFVVDPDGVVDAETGYANDVSASNTDAWLPAFLTPKAGLYLFACRTLQGSGGYRLTVAKTGSPTPSTFTTLPYGDAAINVMESPGQPSIATLQALVLDPLGEPAAGATPTWQVTSGSIASSSWVPGTHLPSWHTLKAGNRCAMRRACATHRRRQIRTWHPSSPEGIAQASITMGSEESATLEPVFAWAYPPPQGVAVRAQGAAADRPSPAPGAEGSGVFAGQVVMDPLLRAVSASRLLEPAAIEAARRTLARAKSAAAKARPTRAPIAMALGVSCNLPAHEVKRLRLPAGAASIESLSLALTGEAGTPLPDPLTGLKVREQKSASLSLVAHCKDANGVPFDTALPGAVIRVHVVSTSPALAGGIVADGETCHSATLTMEGQAQPFLYELGKRAVFTSLDASQQAHLAATEVLGAGVRAQARNTTGQWTSLAARAAVEVAPEPGPPASFAWFDPQYRRETAHFSQPPTQMPPYPCSDEGAIITTETYRGSPFALLDRDGNVVVGWGGSDTAWHTQQGSDQVHVVSAGECPGVWMGVRYEPASDPAVYLPVVFTSFLISRLDPATGQYIQSWEPDYHGPTTRTICAVPGGDHPPVCEAFTLDNSPGLNYLGLRGPWLDDGWGGLTCAQECVQAADGSIHCSPTEEYWSPKCHSAVPGGPVLVLPTGSQALLRVDPVADSDLDPEINPDPGGQPHRVSFSGVAVRAWVNGPLAGPDVVGMTRSAPGDPFELTQVADVELCTGMMTAVTWHSSLGTCGASWAGEAPLSASTDSYNPGDQAASISAHPPFQVVGISKAPKTPGWYKLVVETSDARFNQPGQQLPRSTFTFSVAGGEILDASFNRIDAFTVTEPTTAYVRYLDPAETAGTVTVELTIEDEQGVFDRISDLDLHRTGVSNVFLSDAITLLPPWWSAPPQGMRARAAAASPKVKVPPTANATAKVKKKDPPKTVIAERPVKTRTGYDLTFGRTMKLAMYRAAPLQVSPEGPDVRYGICAPEANDCGSDRVADNDIAWSFPQGVNAEGANQIARTELEPGPDPEPGWYLRGIRMTTKLDGTERIPGGKMTLIGTAYSDTARQQSVQIEVKQPSMLGAGTDHRGNPIAGFPDFARDYFGISVSLKDEIIKAADERGVPPQYLAAQAYKESSFNVFAFRYEPANWDYRWLVGDGYDDTTGGVCSDSKSGPVRKLLAGNLAYVEQRMSNGPAGGAGGNRVEFLPCVVPFANPPVGCTSADQPLPQPSTRSLVPDTTDPSLRRWLIPGLAAGDRVQLGVDVTRNGVQTLTQVFPPGQPAAGSSDLYEVNGDTGAVTFGAPQAEGVTLTARFTKLVPARPDSPTGEGGKLVPFGALATIDDAIAKIRDENSEPVANLPPTPQGKHKTMRAWMQARASYGYADPVAPNELFRYGRWFGVNHPDSLWALMQTDPSFDVQGQWFGAASYGLLQLNPDIYRDTLSGLGPLGDQVRAQYYNPVEQSPFKLFDPRVCVPMGAFTDANINDIAEGIPREAEDSACPEPRPRQCTWEKHWYRRLCVFNLGNAPHDGTCPYSESIFVGEDGNPPIAGSFVPLP